MTIPASPAQQPIAVTHRPVTAQNAQFDVVPPGMAGDRSATHKADTVAECRSGRLLDVTVADPYLPSR